LSAGIFKVIGRARWEEYVDAEMWIGERNVVKRAALVTTICFLFLTSTAFAQSVDGKWTTDLHAQGLDGQIITLTLKSDGNKLTGTLYGIQPIPLEGSIEGNTLKIKLKVTTSSGGELLLNYTAILEGDEIKFSYQSENGRPPVFGPKAQEFTARRVK
jgi:hypothetical protein